jgi:transcriptional regulator with XRE-family HTH domain
MQQPKENTPKNVGEEIAIGTNIRKWRIDKDIKQEDLARRIGIDREVLSKIENNKKDVSFSLMKNLANGLEITLKELIFLRPNGVSFFQNAPYSNGIYNLQNLNQNDPVLISLLKEIIENLKQK